jgi:hypothetical protein
MATEAATAAPAWMASTGIGRTAIAAAAAAEICTGLRGEADADEATPRSAVVTCPAMTACLG